MMRAKQSTIPVGPPKHYFGVGLRFVGGDDCQKRNAAIHKKRMGNSEQLCSTLDQTEDAPRNLHEVSVRCFHQR